MARRKSRIYKDKVEVGVQNPEMVALCQSLQMSINQFEYLSPAEVLAALEMVKLEFQLELFGVLVQDSGGEGE